MAVVSQTLVGMSEIKICKGSGVLTCLGLGSCIGVIAYDPVSEVAGMVHVMLPESFKDKVVDKPGKFANTGIPQMIRMIEAEGAEKRRLKFSYAGGAQVFKYGAETTRTLDVGTRNGAAVKDELGKISARILGSDIGGTCGRTVTFDLTTGEVKVRTVSGGEKVLCNLKGAA